MRDFISFAALLVKVRAKTCHGAARFLSKIYPPGLLDGVDVSLPDVELGHAVDKMVNVTEGILSMGDTSGGIGGGGPKDISKKKKKKDDRDREGRGRGY